MALDRSTYDRPGDRALPFQLYFHMVSKMYLNLLIFILKFKKQGPFDLET